MVKGIIPGFESEIVRASGNRKFRIIRGRKYRLCASAICVGKVGIAGSRAQNPITAGCSDCPFFCAVITGNGIAACHGGSLYVEANSCSTFFRYAFRQHEIIRTFIDDQQVLTTAD